MNPKKIPTHNLKITALLGWFILIITGFTGTSFFLLSSFEKVSADSNEGYYGAKSPQVMGATFETESADPRAVKIENIFKKYKCPLAGNGAFVVSKADEHNIPYWLVPAVSFQESGCGKNTPSMGGVESYNAWGYGVFGGKVTTFENWEEGISTLSKYFDKNFYSKGVTDPCEIMRTYTPPSKGSWCAGVKYFGEMIENFESE